MTAEKCLRETGSYRYGSTFLKNGREVPYTVIFPKRMPLGMHKELMLRSKQILPWETWPGDLTVFGIAQSGIPLAQAVTEGLCEVVRNVRLDILDPKRDKAQILSAVSEPSIIVDNAVTTGASLHWAHQLLVRRGYQVLAAVRYFSREEVEEEGISQEERTVRDENIELLSLFGVRDLIPLIPATELQELHKHLTKYGTTSIRQYLEAMYVFENGTWSPR